MDRRFEAERNNSGKLSFETSSLCQHLGELESEEFKKDGLTLFDLALLLKISTPAAEFDRKVGKDVLKEAFNLVYDYMQAIVLSADLDWIYGNFLYAQAEQFDKNVDWYLANWKDDFSGYVNELMKIAVNEFENKKMLEGEEMNKLYNRLRDLVKQSKKRRE